jgi:uncharacterized YigZ family protein
MVASFKTVAAHEQELFKEKASKFFAHVYPVTSEEEVKTVLADLKKQYYDSRHICYAYVLGTDKNIFRVNDAGEPSNTAGKPILGQISAFDLTNVLVVVVRYFGGTKLGVGGLIQAYKTAAQLVLQKAEILKREVMVSFTVECAYDNLSHVLKAIKNVNGEVIENIQAVFCTIKCRVPLKDETIFMKAVELKINAICVNEN